MTTNDGANTPVVAVSTRDDAASHAARATLWWSVAELLEPSLQVVHIVALREMLGAVVPPAALQETWYDLRRAFGAMRLGDRPQQEVVLRCARDLRFLARVEDALAFSTSMQCAGDVERIGCQLGDFLNGPGGARIEAAAAVLATDDSTAQPLAGRALVRLMAAPMAPSGITGGCQRITSISVNADPAGAPLGPIVRAPHKMISMKSHPCADFAG